MKLISVLSSSRRLRALAHAPQRVKNLSHPQRERLAYIKFRLCFIGEIDRPDLSSRYRRIHAPALERRLLPQPPSG
jgi:hypothetical protein